MFRKKGVKLEKALVDAGVNLDFNLGKCLLSKMIEHGMGNENIEIEVDQVYEFQIYRKGSAEDDLKSVMDNFLAYINRHFRSDLWDVTIVIDENDISLPYSNREVVHSKHDLFGKLVERV